MEIFGKLMIGVLSQGAAPLQGEPGPPPRTLYNALMLSASSWMAFSLSALGAMLLALSALPDLTGWLVPSAGIAGWGAASLWAYRRSLRRWPQGKGGTFLLFSWLQVPDFIVLGSLAGLLVGYAGEFALGRTIQGWLWLGLLAAGLASSAALRLLARLPQPYLRSGLLLPLAAGLAVGAVLLLRGWFGQDGWHSLLLVGLPWLGASILSLFFFFLSSDALDEGGMAFSGALLAVGLWLVLPPPVRAAAVVLPVLLFLAFRWQLQRHLLAAKAALIGIGQQRVGNLPAALAAFRQALHAVPNYPAAQEGLWQIHRDLNLPDLLANPTLHRLLDYEMCLERAKTLLLGRSPTPQQLEDARRLLRLVEQQQPQRRFLVQYWLAVAALHGGEVDHAGKLLRQLLDDREHAPDTDADRLPALVPAWHLVLLGHPALKSSVGQPLLAEGRRCSAIAAVEKTLVLDEKDELALALKAELYRDLTAAEYEKEAGTDPVGSASHFDHARCHELGKALLEGAEWRRGVELCRIAARGKPEKAPTLLRHLVAVAEHHGSAEVARSLRHHIAALGHRLGAGQFSPEAQADYFAVIKELADEALAAGEDTRALELLQVYSSGPSSGADTLRQIASLHEKRGDVLAALVTNQRCLVYDARHPEHLQRRDRCYYSLFPAELRANWDRLKTAFDLDYCLNRARELLDHPKAGPEQVDWALHLLELAQAVAGENLSARLLLARARLLRGEKHLAMPLLEAAVAQGQAEAPAGATEEDWLLANRLLGDLLLEENLPERALPCYTTYRKSAKSGAATLLKMGKCFELLGNPAQAIKCYENVAYYNNPLAADARQALDRLRAR